MRNKTPDLKKLDVVYVVKDSAFNDELRYSLRSVEQNLPHNRVIFYGGKPVGSHPDIAILVKQIGKHKYQKVANMLFSIAEDDFILMNDDFFVLNKIDKLPYYYSDDLEKLSGRISAAHGGPSAYTRRIDATRKWLKESKYATRNYELHVPIIFNREKLRRIFDINTEHKYATRSLYCNVDKVMGKKSQDMKIFDLDKLPRFSDTFVSTTDLSFAEGQVGKFIRALFKDKSRYE